MTSTAANSEACQSGRVTLSISGGPGCTSRSLDRLIAGAGNALYAARPNGKDHIVASPAYGPGHGFPGRDDRLAERARAPIAFRSGARRTASLIRSAHPRSDRSVVPVPLMPNSGGWLAAQDHLINSTHFDRHAGGSHGSVT